MKTTKTGVLFSVLAFSVLSTGLWAQSLPLMKSVVDENSRAEKRAKPGTAPEKFSAIYTVYLSGELRDVIGKKDAGKSTFGTASFGISRVDKQLDLTLLIKVADNQAPVTENFGRALLNPGGLERASAYADFAYHLSDFKLRAYGAITTNEWLLTGLTGETISAQATILTFGAGVYKNIWDEMIEEASSRIVSNVFLGFTGRCISGDLGFDTNAGLRRSLLGADNRFFPGGELYLDLFFSGIKGFADITWFPFRPEIPGFSKVRLTAGIGLQLDVLTFKRY